MAASRQIGFWTGLVVSGLAISSAPAGLVAYEGFNYANGSTLSAANALDGGSGWGSTPSAWRSGGLNDFSVSTTGALSFPGLDSIGGSAYSGTVGTPTNARQLPALSGDFYISALFNKNADSTAGYLSLSLLGAFPSNSSIAGFGLSDKSKVYAGPAGTNPRTGIDKTTTEYGNGNTLLLVAKVDRANSRLSVWNVPAGTTALPATPTVSYVFTSTLPVAQVQFSGSYGGYGFMDELRIGTSYADVAPVPEPAGAAILLMGGLALSCHRNVERRRGS